MGCDRAAEPVPVVASTPAAVVDAAPAVPSAPPPAERAGPTIRVVHTEFQSADAKATNAFLGALFGRDGKESPTPAGPLYEFAAAAGTSFAVRNAADHEGGPGTTVYFETDDLDASFAKATKLGAKIIVPRMTFAGKGHIGWVEAPGGVRMAFLQRIEGVESTGQFPTQTLDAGAAPQN